MQHACHALFLQACQFVEECPHTEGVFQSGIILLFYDALRGMIRAILLRRHLPSARGEYVVTTTLITEQPPSAEQ